MAWLGASSVNARTLQRKITHVYSARRLAHPVASASFASSLEKGFRDP
jgi:hypothetical protein